jgi:hypothetical protein
MLSHRLNATTVFADFSRARAPEISPGKDLNFRCAAPDSTRCVLMDLGLCRHSPARRPHPASRSVCVPALAPSLTASFSLSLTESALLFSYRYHHRFGQVPFSLIVHAHAGHTSPASRWIWCGDRSPLWDGETCLPVPKRSRAFTPLRLLPVTGLRAIHPLLTAWPCRLFGYRGIGGYRGRRPCAGNPPRHRP